MTKNKKWQMKLNKSIWRIVLFTVICTAMICAMGYFNPIFATCGEKTAKYGEAFTTKWEINGNYADKIPTRSSEEDGGEDTLPDEYGDFIASLPDRVQDVLPEEIFGESTESLSGAAGEISSVSYLLARLFDAFGSALTELLPTLALLCAIVIFLALAKAFASNLGGLSQAVEFAAGLGSYCAIAAVSVSSLERLSEYFDTLLGVVAAFVPLSGVLYAAGGNINGAASGTVTLSATLAVCQFFFSKTVIPLFCICLSLTLLSVFEGGGGITGRTVSSSIKKWYTTALSFVMMILSIAVGAQSILSAKADGVAMRGVKFAAGSFIPVVGGTVSGTLGTLAASVELIRGSVGVIGIVIIILLLIPIIVELAALRGIFALVSFVSGMLGCGGEKSLLDEVGSLYGYLEGIAVLSAVVFLIAFAVFAATTAAVV